MITPQPIDNPRGPLELLCKPDGWSPDIAFLIRQGNARVSKMEMMQHDPNMIESTEPTFRLDRREAQQLMDNLWSCGLRPSEGAGSAGAMAATQKHLEDMRTLVFKPQNS